MFISLKTSSEFKLKNQSFYRVYRIYIMQILILTTIALFSFNSYSQSSQEERALIEYAKKYDKEQMDKRVDEIERKLNGTYYSKPDRAFSIIGYIFGLAVLAAVVSELVKSKKNSDLNKELEKKRDDFKSRMENFKNEQEKRWHLFNNPIDAIAKEDLPNMTVSEIQKVIDKSEDSVKSELARNGLICADFDGKKFLDLMGPDVPTDSAHSVEFGNRFNEVQKYLKDSELKLSLKLEDDEARRNNHQIMYFKASTAPEKDIATEIFVSCFDSGGKLVPGCYLENGVDNFYGDFDFNSGIKFKRNYNLDGIKNGPSFFSDTIRIDAFKIPDSINYVLFSVFTAFDPFSYLDDEDEIKAARKNQKQFEIDVRSRGLDSIPESYNWIIKGGVNRMLLLGYIERVDESFWVFKKLDDKFIGSKFLHYDDDDSIKRVCERLQDFVISNIAAK